MPKPGDLSYRVSHLSVDGGAFVAGAIPPGSLATYVAPRGVRVPVRVLGYRDYGPGRGPSVYLRTTGRVCARFGFPTGEEWEASCSFLVPRRGVR